MIQSRDIFWLAGILEGEGCFSYKRTPNIQLSMTDRDIVARVSNLTGFAMYSDKRPNRKRAYRTNVTGARAAGWMMTLYSLMGKRRRVKIKQCLSAWRLAPNRPKEAPKLCQHAKRVHGKGLCGVCYNRVYRTAVKAARAAKGAK